MKIENTVVDKIYPEDDPDVKVVRQFRKLKTFWTLKDFAEFTGLTYRSVWNMVKEGKIKAVKFEKEWKIHYQTVVDYIKKRNSLYID